MSIHRVGSGGEVSCPPIKSATAAPSREERVDAVAKKTFESKAEPTTLPEIKRPVTPQAAHEGPAVSSTVDATARARLADKTGPRNLPKIPLLDTLGRGRAFSDNQGGAPRSRDKYHGDGMNENGGFSVNRFIDAARAAAK